jgi:ribose-phosphate pyrophosphokinase
MRDEMPFLHVVSSARLSAEVIMRMHEEGSLSPFFDPFNAWQYLSSMKLFL